MKNFIFLSLVCTYQISYSQSLTLTPTGTQNSSSSRIPTSANSTLNLEGQNPLIGLTRNFPSTTWHLRIGNVTNGYLGNSDFTITNLTTKSIGLSISDNGNVVIGGSSIPASYLNSRLFVYGGTTGANLDLRGLPERFKDQAIVELQGSDYDENVQSLVIQYYGIRSGLSYSILGYNTVNMGRIAFGGTSGLIYTANDAPLVFGTNNLARMKIAPNGVISIGTIENLEATIEGLRTEITNLKNIVEALRFQLQNRN